MSTMWRVLLLLLLLEWVDAGTPTATMTITDSMTETETETESKSLSLTETMTITDSMTETETITETETDSLSSTITMTITDTMSVSKTLSESLSITISNSLSDSLSSTISLSTTDTLSVTSTDSLSKTFTITTTATISVSPTLSISNTDTESISLSLSLPTPTTTMTSSLTETETVSKSVTLSLTESVSRSVSESISLSFSLSNTISVTPTFSETITATDSRSLTESVTATDSISKTLTISVTPTDTLTSTETASFTGTFSLTGSDSLTLTNSISLSLPTSTETFSNSLTGSLSLSKSVSLSFTETVSESFTLVPTPTRPLPYYPPLTPAELVVDDNNVRIEVSNSVLVSLNSAWCQEWPSGKCGCVPVPCHGPFHGSNPGWISALATQLGVSAARIRAFQQSGGESVTGRHLTDRFSENSFTTIASLTSVVPFSGTLHLAGLPHAESFTDEQLLAMAASYKKDLLYTYFVNTTDSTALTVMAVKDTNGLYIRHSLDTSVLPKPSDTVQRYHMQYNEDNVIAKNLETSIVNERGGGLKLVHIVDSDISNYGVDRKTFSIRGFTSAVVGKATDLMRLEVGFRGVIADSLNQPASVVTIHTLETSMGLITYSVNVALTGLTESVVIQRLYSNIIMNGGLNLSTVQTVWDSIVRINVRYDNQPTPSIPVQNIPYITACWGNNCTSPVARREVSSVGIISFAIGSNLDATVISEALSDSVGMPSSQVHVQYDPVTRKATWMLDTTGFNKDGLSVRLSQLSTSFSLQSSDPTYRPTPVVDTVPFVQGVAQSGSTAAQIRSEIITELRLSDCQNPQSVVIVSPIVGSNAMKVSFGSCIRTTQISSMFEIRTTEDITNTLSDTELLGRIIERASCCNGTCSANAYCTTLGINRVASPTAEYCPLLSGLDGTCNRTTGCSFNGTSTTCLPAAASSTPTPPSGSDDDFPVIVVVSSLVGFVFLVIIIVCCCMRSRTPNRDLYDYPAPGDSTETEEREEPTAENKDISYGTYGSNRQSPVDPQAASLSGMANPLSLPIQFEGDGLNFVPAVEPAVGGEIAFRLSALPENNNNSPSYPSPPISRYVKNEYTDTRRSPLATHSLSGNGRGSISPPPLPSRSPKAAVPFQSSYGSYPEPPIQSTGTIYNPPPVC